MRLTVVYAERPSCNVALHGSDARQLFRGHATRHFCHALQLRKIHAGGEEATELRSSPASYVGWAGDAALAKGTLEVAQTFANCLNLEENEIVEASAVADVSVAESVMLQPHGSDDWEVVELEANYIEEHLLAQIAVLTPGLVFPVWIRGQMPVKLSVDPKDENQGLCFLLGRDSELYIESKQRAAVGPQSVSVFGSTASRDAEDRTEEQERSLQLRVFGFLPELDTPTGFVHPLDLERLLGYVEPAGCLVWLAFQASAADSGAPSKEPNGSRAPHGVSNSNTNGVTHDGASEGSPHKHSNSRADTMLLKLEGRADVLRCHIKLGSCMEEHMRVPCFSFVRLWRCRQVPVYVPHIELSPLSPCKWKAAANEDARWLSRLLERLVDACGELNVMDGAVLQLPDPDYDFGKNKTTVIDGCLAAASPRSHRPTSVGSEITDLYEGLSDIDDIYGSSLPTCEVIGDGLGIYEVDLGLDDVDDWDSFRAGHPIETQPDADSMLPPRPEKVPVCIRFDLGTARLGGSRTPPFVRLTPNSFIQDLTVTVAWPTEGTVQGIDTKDGSKQHSHPLATLWSLTPGLRVFPEETWLEVIQLICQQSSSPLDSKDLFRKPATQLKRHLLAQLGSAACTSSNGSTEEVLIACGEKHAQPVEPVLQTAVAPGAAAVIGARGSGKTTLCRQVCGELAQEGVMCLEVSCGKLGQPTRKFATVQEWLRGIFRFATWHSPSVVLFDDFGALCPDVEQGAPNLSITEERSVMLAEMFLDMLPEIRVSGGRVALAATLPGDSAVHTTLWRALALECKVALRPPLMKERPEIVQVLCQQKADSGWDVDAALLAEGALDEWGGRVDGFSVADLGMLVERACIEATVEASTGLLHGSDSARWADQRRLTVRHLERAVENFVPATMADQSFFTSSVRWSDIGGLESSKHTLLDMLTMSTKYAVLVDRAPVKTRKGLMLVGPPGCGKTMLVQAAANETKGLLRFLTVKGPELLSKYIGASEAGVRQKFEQAAAAAPCVIFFDEIEALAPKRGADSTGVTDRVVNQMLCYLDGVEDRGRVYVVAATSRPDLVDPALMRPGRFDKICFCGLPTDEERLQICEIQAAKHGLVIGASEEQLNGADMRTHLRRLVSRLPRLFTSADIDAIFSTAKIEAVTSSLHDKAPRDTNGVSSIGARPQMPVMTMSHVFAALSSAKASISEADDHRYSRIFAPYRPGGLPSALRRDGSETSSGTKVALA